MTIAERWDVMDRRRLPHHGVAGSPLDLWAAAYRCAPPFSRPVIAAGELARRDHA